MEPKKECNYRTFKVDVHKSEASIELSNSIKSYSPGPANKRSRKEKQKN